MTTQATDWRTEAAERKARILATLDRLKLTLDSEFVPLSRSRNAGEKYPTLNWKVTVKRDGRAVLTTDYSSGCAHCPSYQQRASVDSAAAVKAECETGKAQGWQTIAGGGAKVRLAPILPDPCDVFYSLALDSDVIDHPTYESWASDFGYDADSRKGEAAYRLCLEISLKLRAAVGDSGLAELRAAAIAKARG